MEKLPLGPGGKSNFRFKYFILLFFGLASKNAAYFEMYVSRKTSGLLRK
jgi:hypothetical protein